MLQPLPAFDRLNPDEAQAALEQVLAANRKDLERMLARESHGWETLIEALEDMGDRVSRVWGPTAHLFSVWSTPAWRAAYNAGLPKITEYGVELSQNEALYRAYKSIQESPAFAQFSPARKKVITDALRDFRLAGITLPADQKARFKVLSLRLSELHAKFEEHLMDCVQAWSRHVTDEAQLDGMTEAGKQAAASKAKAKGLDGWLLTLDFPSYDAVISKAKHRELRRAVYEAFATRASEQGPHDRKFDNTALMSEILALRHEQAQLLGFKNFAELSLATKMAESPNEVELFLRDLAKRARPRAQAELDELRELAAADGVSDLQAWDTAYYSEKLRQQKLGLSDEALRPYFPFPQVVRGMFDLVERLYDVKIEPVAGIATWHADVTTYALKHRNGDTFGVFYLDPYARPETKRGGAWMDECVVRRKLPIGGVQMPAAYLVCNFTPPLGGQPALLNHDEVLTLFHEFGHGLHHLLTRVDEASVAGIRGVAWDAVELPSQFMENWCYEPATLKLFARHWQTREPMPDDMIAKLRADRQFQTGLATLRQLEFSLFDLLLHRDYEPGKGARVYETLEAVRRDVAVFDPPPGNRMPNSFSHIFAGGYAAGYYSYKWAEVLSSDAFAAFEEANFAPEIGHRFRDTVLAQGGSREAMELFVAFRGRKPSVEPLLRHSGLASEAA
jgi:oligopeptidase A